MPIATHGASERCGTRYLERKDAVEDHRPALRTFSTSKERKKAKEEAYFRT